MKNYTTTLFFILFLFTTSSNLQAQFFKKLQKKIDKKIEQVFESDEDKNDTASSNTSGDNFDSSEYTTNYEDFVTGETTIFFDSLSGKEVIHQHPTRWRTSFANDKDNSEIIEIEGEKVIRLGSRQGISPVISNNKEDYLPDNFTLEFDASFSANALDQRYYINFYDQKTQNDIVEWEARNNELTLKTYGCTDNMTEGTLKNHEISEESSKPVWRHIAMTYKNNTLEVYYDGQHIFHKGDIKGNLIGLTIGRSEFGTNDRYLKNITIATN